MFGQDFFKMLQFIMDALRLFARIFGDENDKVNDDKNQSNHRHEIEKIIHAGKKAT